ncbi:hypothetical protein FS837_003823, partial [Tulasnella sp. UAMH 9824]
MAFKGGNTTTDGNTERILDMGSDAYKESAELETKVTKPQALMETDFRLSDDLFPFSQVTGGPTGDKLVPNWDTPGKDILEAVSEKWAEHIPKQQDKVPKPDITPEKISRVDKPGDDPEWDLYNQKLATLGLVVDKKLEALWTVVLVRGD